MSGRSDITQTGVLEGTIPSPLKRFLALDGDGACEILADHAAVPGTYWIGPSLGCFWAIYRMLIYIEATGQFATTRYGILDTLDPGLVLRVHRTSTGETITLTDRAPIRSSADIARHCYDSQFIDFGVGANATAGRWTFNYGGAPVPLDGNKGDQLELLAADDFTDLDSHTYKADGVVLLGCNEVQAMDWDA